MGSQDAKHQTILPNDIHVLIFADDDIKDFCTSYPFFPAHTTFGQPAVKITL